MPRAGVVAAALCALAWPAAASGRPLASPAAPAACSRGSGPVDVRISPRHGPVGTRVRITGRCFARRWNHGYGIFLRHQFAKPRECELLAGEAFGFRVNRRRVGRGWFEVASSGSCFQERHGRRVTPARYYIGFGCHACVIGRFRVTR